ncbi:flagellar basal body-associated FliL family protein [Undibacterium sp. Ren11W]|uniref:flagellar basal body-associated FliL family protein n=1 Tax=Undibacterium sp. Ren11W TaxID=3413045 RepID=UPI003BF1D856
MRGFRLSAFVFSAMLAVAIFFPVDVMANSGGGSASPAAGNTAKLEPFIVNLSGFEKYLQVSLTLQVATPEIAEKVKLLMPMIRHGLILILSSKEASQLQSGDGKIEVMDEIKEKVNKVLEVKEHDGVSEIFFENFIIQ